MNTEITAGSFEDLYTDEFQEKLISTPSAVLLDVRTPEEFHNGKIPKSININVADSFFIEKISTLDKSILCVLS